MENTKIIMHGEPLEVPESWKANGMDFVSKDSEEYKKMCEIKPEWDFEED